MYEKHTDVKLKACIFEFDKQSFPTGLTIWGSLAGPESSFLYASLKYPLGLLLNWAKVLFTEKELQKMLIWENLNGALSYLCWTLFAFERHYYVDRYDFS